MKYWGNNAQKKSSLKTEVSDCRGSKYSKIFLHISWLNAQTDDEALKCFSAYLAMPNIQSSSASDSGGRRPCREDRDYISAVGEPNCLFDVTNNNSPREHQQVTLTSPEGKYDQVLF